MLRENVYLDSVVYSAAGVAAAVKVVGKERVLFGTDHPFFPPLEQEEQAGGEKEKEWLSVRTNVEAVREAFGSDEEGARGVLGDNAVALLGLEAVGGG